MRAGAQTLTLLGAPRNYLILRALVEAPKGQLELRRAAGSPAQSTLRGQLRTLAEIGAIERRRRDAFPGALEFELTESGRELLVVGEHLSRWLSRAPAGPLELGGDAAKAAVKGLVDGWIGYMLRPLADGPLSLTELDRRVSTISYPTIERRLETMRLADQVKVGSRAGAGTPYELNPWLRRGIAPIVVAARWEDRNRPDEAAPITRLEVDTALAIARPLLAIEPALSGVCQVSVRAPTPEKKRRRLLPAIVVRDGEIISFSGAYPQRKPDAWASGTSEAWLSTLIDGERRGLRVSGDRAMIDALLGSIHMALFAEVVPREDVEQQLVPNKTD